MKNAITLLTLFTTMTINAQWVQDTSCDKKSIKSH